jgi:hypothetical protein
MNCMNSCQRSIVNYKKKSSYSTNCTYTETYTNGFYMVTCTSAGTITFEINIPILSVIVLGSGGGGGYGSDSYAGGGGRSGWMWNN